MDKDYYILDDRHEIFNLYKSQCATCRHYCRDKYSCAAFPTGIPNAILAGEKQHNDIIYGQQGRIVYSAK